MEEERIVMYPAPGISHIVAMVELAKLLQTHRFNLTILLTTGFLDHPSVHTYIRRISADHPSISFLRLPHAAPSTATTSFAAKAFTFINRNFSNVATTLSQISNTATVKAFVTDLFCSSVVEAASSLRIPVFYFFASGVSSLAILSYLPKLHEETSASFKDLVGVELRVPGNAPQKAVYMPQPVLDREDPAYREMLDISTRLSEASGVLVNTFPELEAMAVKAFLDGACVPHSHLAPPLYCIGPLIAEAQLSGPLFSIEIITQTFSSAIQNILPY
ncbi:unnamed protein product [Sphenostylis stenocarpa]|uniref:Uncharacterized protein n=1 Tax=Sphenostylis stenocarpa TaxID=92480 RepID=A0AA86SUC2_9FABA|nr:unnamed protein product [Sphenostylis stenocarpa]